MQKNQLNVRLDSEVIKNLTTAADKYGLTANSILAAAACELARINTDRPGELWHALGRIAGDGALELIPGNGESLPPARKRPQPALTAGR